MGAQAEEGRLTRAAAALLALLALGAAGCPEGPTCDEKTPLVAMDAFEVVAPEDDPFSPPADAPLCTGSEIRSEPFGNGPVALDVDTNGSCGWATVKQASRVELVATDHVLPRLFYFSQQTFPAATAEVALRIGEETVWSLQVPIPTDSKLKAPDLAPRIDAAEGTPVYFHIGNHGANVWSLLELVRLRQVPCEDTTDAGGG